MGHILVIDDDPQICRVLAKNAERLGHTATTSQTLGEGLRQAQSLPVDLVFLDVHMPDGNGLEALPAIAASPSQPEVVIITGMGDPDGAEMAIKSGAWSYIEKGTSLSQLSLALERALQFRAEKQASLAPVALKLTGIVGNSPAMHACYDLLAKAAASQMNVLVSGETGTGKELFARAIHNNSVRANASLVVVDCAALPETLVESILFGHERGAFTGADRSQEGLISQAHQGTLFLDEVGELPLGVQKSFLRVLQEHRFRPLGGSREQTSDFRLVAATNRDLEAMAAAGEFRQDLLFRLRSLTITLPCLRQRPEDIKDLAVYYLDRICQRLGLAMKGLGPGLFEVMDGYPWPGNVRELIGALEYAISAAGDSPTLFHQHLPEAIRIAHVRASLQEEETRQERPLGNLAHDQELPPMREMIQSETAKLEKWYLSQLMARTGGDIKQSCQISGLSRSVLYEYLRKHGLSRKG